MSREAWQSRYYHGEKVTFYRKCKLEKFAQYSQVGVLSQVQIGEIRAVLAGRSSTANANWKNARSTRRYHGPSLTRIMDHHGRTVVACGRESLCIRVCTQVFVSLWSIASSCRTDFPDRSSGFFRPQDSSGRGLAAIKDTCVYLHLLQIEGRGAEDSTGRFFLIFPDGRPGAANNEIQGFEANKAGVHRGAVSQPAGQTHQATPLALGEQAGG